MSEEALFLIVLPFKTYLNFRNSLFLLYKNLPDNKLHSYYVYKETFDGLAAMYFLVKGSFRSVRAVWKAHMDFYRVINGLREKREVIKKIRD
jgi:hypothetical protein